MTVAVLLAAGLDWTVREPPDAVHPVALFGRIVDRVSAPDWPAPTLAGALVAVTASMAAAAVAYGVVVLADSFHAMLGAVVAGLVLWTTASLRLLLDVAERVVADSDADPGAARQALPALVGRDVDLSPPLVRSAAVESLAENLSDGLVAPLLAFGALATVSLPAAAAGAAFVRAVDTLDSMLGYPGAFGRASARLDDVVMFVPARVSAALLGLAAGDPDAPLRARRYARLPASPNAGWPMGTLAAALDVRLEKPGHYVLNEVADSPDLADGRAALRATRRAGATAYGLVAAFGVVLWL